jgi:hypothetical protein
MRQPASDVVVMQTAITGEADFLCTRDQDFYAPEVLTYLEGMGARVLDDVALVHRSRPWPAQNRTTSLCASLAILEVNLDRLW